MAGYFAGWILSCHPANIIKALSFLRPSLHSQWDRRCYLLPFFTSPVGAVAKYCDEHVSVCMSPRIYSEPCAISANFSVHVAYGRGSVLPRQSDEMLRGRGSFGWFSSPLTMHCNALAAKGIIRSPVTSCSRRDHSVAATFAANGIGQEGGDGSAQHT